MGRIGRSTAQAADEDDDELVFSDDEAEAPQQPAISKRGRVVVDDSDED